MKNLLLPLLLLVASASLYSQAASDTTEPKPQFLLKINGKEYSIAEGQEMKFDSTFRQPTLSVKMMDYKKFENNFIAFEYPRSYGYEFEESEGLRNWTLNGNNLTMMLFEMTGSVTIDAFADGMVTKFGKKNCKLDNIEKQLGSKTLKGKRILVNIAGAKLTIDIYSLHSGGLLSEFIIFQDSIKDNGGASDESTASLKLFNSTVKYK